VSKWVAAKSNWTPVAVADAAAFTDNGYMALQGGTTTQLITVSEFMIEGLASAQAPSQLVASLDSTVGATSLTGVTIRPMNPLASPLASPVLSFSASTTKPQRSNLGPLLTLSLNTFGGLSRWVAYPGEEIWVFGNAVNQGELSLSHLSTGTPALISSHIVFEPV
jgi:hypothetical protein